MKYARHIVIGDVHGCLEEMNELLRQVAVTSNDCLIFAGDLVDRGPDPVGCVRRARELGALCVMGNHEEKHIRWRSWESRIQAGEAKKNPMRRFDERRMIEHNNLQKEDMDYLNAMPKLIRFGDLSKWIVVHAGFECDGTYPDQQARDTVCRVRDVDAEGKMASDHKNPLVSAPGSVPWATKWTGPENVIYGHAVYSLSDARVDQHDGYACYGIDTGCVFGGKLTALIVTEDSKWTSTQLVHVQAKQEYHPRANIARND